MVGEKIRQARLAQHLSLTQVASKAKVSVATLSRVETEKQALDVTLLLVLAKILKVPAHELLGSHDGQDESEPLVARIAALDAPERTKLWRDLADNRRESRERRRNNTREFAQQIDELVAQIEFVREELDSVRLKIRKR